MKERMLNLFSLCMDAKKVGADAFFFYHPHVGRIDLSVYRHGWKENKKPDTRFYIDAGTESDIKLAEDYLKELISNVCTG